MYSGAFDCCSIYHQHFCTVAGSWGQVWKWCQPLSFLSKLITSLIHFLLISLTLVFFLFLIFPAECFLSIIKPTSKEIQEIQEDWQRRNRNQERIEVVNGPRMSRKGFADSWVLCLLFPFYVFYFQVAYYTQHISHFPLSLQRKPSNSLYKKSDYMKGDKNDNFWFL